MPLCLFMIRWHFPIFTGKINDMEYQTIPIESIKRIEAWLKDETGFDRSMLHNELDYISDVYLLPKKLAEVQDLYLSIRKEEQNIQNPFIREETKCILTEKEKQELRNQLLKIVTQCKDIYHPIIDQTTGYQSISREEVKKIKKRFGENGLVCVAENMNMENYEKVEEFYLDYLEDRETDVTIYEVNNDGSFCSETFIYRNKVLQTFTMTLTWEKGEQAEISNGTANNIAEIKYTSKGYLIYSYEYIVAHAALKEYYRVKPLSDTLRILTDQYVSVFNYLNYNFLTQNWDESNVETILLPRLFEDLYQVHTGEQLKKDSGRISAEIYENVMIACLPVTIEELRKHCGYDMESNTYDSGTFFYRGTSPFGEVVDYLDNSDGTLTLYVDAVWQIGILIVLLKMKLSLNRMAMELVNICLIKYRKLN